MEKKGEESWTIILGMHQLHIARVSLTVHAE